jgi:hypothetical protein
MHEPQGLARPVPTVPPRSRSPFPHRVPSLFSASWFWLMMTNLPATLEGARMPSSTTIGKLAGLYLGAFRASRQTMPHFTATD